LTKLTLLEAKANEQIANEQIANEVNLVNNVRSQYRQCRQKPRVRRRRTLLSQASLAAVPVLLFPSTKG